VALHRNAEKRRRRREEEQEECLSRSRGEDYYFFYVFKQGREERLGPDTNRTIPRTRPDVILVVLSHQNQRTDSVRVSTLSHIQELKTMSVPTHNCCIPRRRPNEITSNV
jgi:hypothetical protein